MTHDLMLNAAIAIMPRRGCPAPAQRCFCDPMVGIIRGLRGKRGVGRRDGIGQI